MQSLTTQLEKFWPSLHKYANWYVAYWYTITLCRHSVITGTLFLTQKTVTKHSKSIAHIYIYSAHIFNHKCGSRNHKGPVALCPYIWNLNSEFFLLSQCSSHVSQLWGSELCIAPATNTSRAASISGATSGRHMEHVHVEWSTYKESLTFSRQSWNCLNIKWTTINTCLQNTASSHQQHIHTEWGQFLLTSPSLYTRKTLYLSGWEVCWCICGRVECQTSAEM